MADFEEAVYYPEDYVSEIIFQGRFLLLVILSGLQHLPPRFPKQSR